ncbi:hypothetical protein N0V93_004519 [Gnomoniopsis smithogilvyi]|uniref:Terpene cyclase/mutase family member n=1 Tax=Gnomoniopsis smithogilvyi TaxID=1191159 RepID=A0A9W9CX59_9PEZI|nr:hypothetical protein N0V93_004519 [Gnomoniopsis smithogilvyi]
MDYKRDSLVLQESASRAVKLAADYAHHTMKPDGHWITELRATVCFTAEYICLRRAMGPPLSQMETAEMRRWIEAQQDASDGSWGLAPGCKGDLNTSTEGYLGLRLLGVPPEEAHMQKARAFILSTGGLNKVGVATQLMLALTGLVRWEDMAHVPAELILMPRASPLSIFAFSYWSRVTAVAIMVLRHQRPVHRIVPEDFLDELYLDPMDRNLHFTPPLGALWRDGEMGRFFGSLADKVAGFAEPVLTRVPGLRSYALSQCVRYILERLDDGGYGSFWNSNFAAIFALHAHGFSTKHPVLQHLLKSVDNSLWKDHDGMRMQVTIGPVWDTALMALGLLETGLSDDRMELTVQWYKNHQILETRGDAHGKNQRLIPGGWPFQYCNSHFPDTDDTLVALLVMIMHNSEDISSQSSIRAIEWLLEMQCSDGGWGCFDLDGDNRYLNLFPFGQGNEFWDPSDAGITGRIMECLGYILSMPSFAKTGSPILRVGVVNAYHKGLKFVEATQEEAGIWFSRWHANYINATSSILCGLMYSAHDEAGSEQIDKIIASPLSWLKSVQNPDGSWGEDVASYSDASMIGKGAGTPTQTAWAIMGLLAFLPPTDAAITKGVEYLVRTQTPSPVSEADGTGIGPGPGATWRQREYVSVGFPDILWLDYASSRHGYPMIALGRWLHKMKEM